VRFQDTGQDHDPSIADVWATPATGGLDSERPAGAAQASIAASAWATAR
jgi:hypothetical protein